jgi:hypothetical protein
MDHMGEREDRDATGAARSVNVVHYIERDQDAAATLVAGLIDRSAAAEGNPSLLVVLPTSDDLLSLGEAVRKHHRDDRAALTPLTSVARARRIVAGGAKAIAGSPADLARLIAESRLTLAGLHTVVLIWPEEVLRDDEQRSFLESVLAEVPRTAERVAIVAQRTADVAPFLERSMWRARTLDHVAPFSASTSPVRVVAAGPAERTRALRSVLDALDPDSAVLLAFTGESESVAHEAASLFGLGESLLDVSRGVPERRFKVGIIIDDVPTAESLDALSAVVDDIVAIVPPLRLAALKKVAPNSTPMTWTGAAANARSAQDALRDEIRGYVGSDAHSTWIPIVEPLLEGIDPVEVAAAALALLDRERRKAKRVAQAPVVATPAPTAERRPREDRPREDRPREERSDRRPPRGDDRGGRPGRDFKSKRPFGAQRDTRGRDDDRRGPPPRRDRDDRPARGDRPARDDRPPRDFRGGGGGPRGARRSPEIERVPRAAHEGREWSERGERLKHSRRGRDRDA